VAVALKHCAQGLYLVGDCMHAAFQMLDYTMLMVLIFGEGRVHTPDVYGVPRAADVYTVYRVRRMCTRCTVCGRCHIHMCRILWSQALAAVVHVCATGCSPACSHGSLQHVHTFDYEPMVAHIQ
jgi:hypothetical protein